MRFILPNIKKENNSLLPEEYPRRTELITKMFLEGWLTDMEITEYLKGIISEAKPFDKNGAIFWAVGDPSTMPSDTRVAWAYEPLYNIVAFMICAYWKKHSFTEELPGFMETLKGGMLAATYRDFKGEDPWDEDYPRRVMKLFERAGADQFLNPGFEADLCPEFTKLFWEWREYYEKQDAIAACNGGDYVSK